MKWSKYLAISISLLIVILMVYFFSNIVTYVLMAWVLSMIGAPIMRLFLKNAHFERIRFGKTISALATLIMFILFAILVFLIFLPPIIQQGAILSELDFNAIAKSLEVPINQLNQWLQRIGIITGEGLDGDKMRLMFAQYFQPAELSGFLSSVLGTAGGIFISIFSVLFISFFFLKEQGLFLQLLKALVPNETEAQVQEALTEVSHMLTRYFGGVVIQISIITLFVSVLLTILGVENALLIGFFAAIINVIPYIGPLIGAILGVFLTITANLDLSFYGELFPLIIKVLAVFASMQVIDNFMLQPFIFSNSVLAHPLEIFIVILMGAQIGGILGMILAIPSYTVIRVIARVFLNRLKIVQKLTYRMQNEFPKKDG